MRLTKLHNSDSIFRLIVFDLRHINQNRQFKTVLPLHCLIQHTTLYTILIVTKLIQYSNSYVSQNCTTWPVAEAKTFTSNDIHISIKIWKVIFNLSRFHFNMQDCENCNTMNTEWILKSRANNKSSIETHTHSIRAFHMFCNQCRDIFCLIQSLINLKKWRSPMETHQGSHSVHTGKGCPTISPLCCL